VDGNGRQQCTSLFTHTESRPAWVSMDYTPSRSPHEIGYSQYGYRRHGADTGVPAGGIPTPKALFHESTDAVSYKSPVTTEQPGSWPRRKADESHSLSEAVSDAASRRDFLAVERLAIKLLSLARQGNTRGIQELAGVAPTITPPPNLTGLSAHSRLSGGTMNFSPFITSVSVSVHGHLQADLVPSGLKVASPANLYETADARSDASNLLNLLEPFMVAAAEHANSTTPRSSPIMGPSSPGLSIPAIKDAIIKQAHHAKRITLREPRLLELASPCHVLGDLHGNLVDLNFFKTLLWPAGPAASAGGFLFLGDFVDRGPDSIAIVAYVIAMKCLEPSKWWLIRGNHETREVNGNTEHYGEGSFLWQCLTQFGDTDGHLV